MPLSLPSSAPEAAFRSRQLRTASGLRGPLLAVVLAGVLSSGLAKAQAPSSPWVGELGVTETVDRIMDRARRAGDLEPVTTIRDSKEEHEVDRKHLRQDPGAPATGIWPPATGARAGLSPVQPGGPGTPSQPQSVGTSFLMATVTESGYIPPDTVAAVGPTQILCVVNGRIKVFSKAGVLGPLNASTNSFFQSVRNNSTTSDPQVKYDPLSGRWIVTMINVTYPNRVLFAVSSGSTITGSSSFTFYYFRQDLVSPTGNSGELADYPKVGVDANAIVVGANMFSTTSYQGTTAWVVRKSSVLSGGPIVATAFRGIAPSSGAGPFAPSGVDNWDPSAADSYVVGVSNNSFGLLVLRRIGDPGGTPSISGNLNVTVPSTTFPMSQVAQGSSSPLDALDDRLFNCQIHRDRVSGVTSLWAAHNFEVNSSGTASGTGNRNGSRWYQLGNLGTTPSLIQSGTLFDSSGSNPKGYWIPSVAMSGQGHAVLGTSYAGAADHAGVAVAGRWSGDALGTIQAPTQAVVSTTNYNVQGGPSQRWGDYSAVMVDPTDDQTLWAFAEYCDATNSWGVRAVQLLAPPPATPVSASPSTLTPGQTGVNVVVTGASSGSSAFYDTEAGFNRIAASFSGSGITVNGITWDAPTQITLNVDVGAGASAGPRDLTVTNPDGQTASSTGGIVTVGGGADCNNNGIPDDQDIANGTSQDCDGNGVPDECQADSDADGTIDACDGCPQDPAKTDPGQCGCGNPDTDTDSDGTADCNDGCPNDPNKTAPGVCGCGVPDTDTDSDGTPDCNDGCPLDPGKIAPGQCGCGVPDTDTDGDGTANCNDGCPNDPNKTSPGICGCGVPDTDTDADGTPDCNDGCPNDPNKTSPGICGCGVPDTDTDSDGTPDCNDGCPNDPNKTAPGQCGCGVADTDTDGDGVADCVDNCDAIQNPMQEDCDGDGVGDVCEIDQGAPDVNGNGVPDDCETIGTAYCFGDGSGATCPCANNGATGHGCNNSAGTGGAVVVAFGATSPDTVVLTATREMPSALTIFLQGTASTTPVFFGDGLRCVGGILKRLYAKSASGGQVSAPGAGDPSITARSAALNDPIQPGQTRYYMTYYRDANPGFCPIPPGNTFNGSNALSILW